MDKNIVIAPVGKCMDALYVGIREYPTKHIILITPKELKDEAENVVKELEKFKISTKILEIEGNIWEETFQKISEIKNQEKYNDIIINVATGDKDNRCAATCAAFVNGIKAFSVSGDEVVLLPILKFSYYRILTDKKIEILKIMYSKDEYRISMEELSRKTGMSLPLISYHINGNLKSDGLKDFGLIVTKEKKGRIDISLTLLGKLLIKGYVPKKY